MNLHSPVSSLTDLCMEKHLHNPETDMASLRKVKDYAKKPS